MWTKLINKDCRKAIKKISTNSIDLIIIDPPYLTTKEVWDKNEVIDENLTKQLFRIAKPSCSLYCWCGIGEKSQSLIRWFPIFGKYFYFKDLITWKKQRGIGMKKGWLYTREEIMWFVKDNKKFVWNKKYQYNSNEERPWSMTKKGGILINKSPYKRLTNVWTDIIEDGFGTSPQKYSKRRLHSAPKPLKAIKRIIQAHTKKGDTVLDCFMGSGTTGITCKQLNRNFIGIEINKQYFDRGSRRIKNTNANN